MDVANLAPSAKLVYLVLKREGPLTQKQLVQQTRLVSRTVRHALTQLEERNLIETRVNRNDARQSFYMLVTDSSE